MAEAYATVGPHPLLFPLYFHHNISYAKKAAGYSLSSVEGLFEEVNFCVTPRPICTTTSKVLKWGCHQIW